jgi:hypothetical protein
MSEIANTPQNLNVQDNNIDKEKIIAEWERELCIKHVAHSLSFAMYRGMDRGIGLTATILSALVSNRAGKKFSGCT